MTLDCPGCKSKLKLDPAKLPPGASAAVCPKCRTKILLPGSAPADEISVQCSQCSSRLKVKVARLKPTASRSKCPKCGNRVDLPAAPSPKVEPGQATQVMQAPPGPQAASGASGPAGMDRSAMTRRLDAKEMGVLLGREGESATSGSPSEQPIEDSTPPAQAFQSSSTDLGRLIDEKVDALGSASPPAPGPAARVGEPSVEDLPFEMPSASTPLAGPPPESAPPARPPVSPGHPAGASSSSGSRQPGSSSGSRAVPSFRSAMPAARPAGSGSKLPAFIMGGMIGGSVVAGALVLAGQFLPDGIAPPVPEIISNMVGGNQSVALTVTMILLSALSGLLAGIALPPEGEGSASRVSIFRCAVAAGLVGLLAGVGVALVRGGADLATMALPAASWTVALILCGLLTGLLARIFASR